MKRLTTKDVLWAITPEQEDMPVKDGGFQNEDGTSNEKLIRQIMDDSAWNEWAWCCVKVSAKWKRFEGVAYLGGCSYASKEDFEKGGYLPQMQEEALDDLNNQINQTIVDFKTLEDQNQI